MDENDDNGPDAEAVDAASERRSGRAKVGDAVLERQKERRERLAKSLRDNLLRRKQQGRARRSGEADEASGLPAAKKDDSGD